MGNQTDELIVRTSLHDPEWDDFVASTEGGHHVQTSLWAQIKSTLGWKPLRVIRMNSNAIIAGLQMLIRSYPVLGKVGYVSKGPIFLHEDRDVVNSIIAQTVRECQFRRIRILAIQPPNNADSISTLLIENHFQRSSMILAPTASVVTDLCPDEERLLMRMHEATRHNIRYGLKNGLTILEGPNDSLKSFYDLHLRTSQRQNFLPYPYEYFETMRDALEPQGYFQLLFVEYDHQPVSCLLLVPFRDVVITKLCGWSGMYAKLKPNDVMQWAAIKWAKSHGYRFLDFDGFDRERANLLLRGEPLPESWTHTPDHFKYGFGGEVVLYPEAYDYVPFKPYRWIYRKLDSYQNNNSGVSRVLDFLRKR